MTASEPITAAIAASDTPSPSGTKVRSPNAAPSGSWMTGAEPENPISASEAAAASRLKAVARACWRPEARSLTSQTARPPSHGRRITRTTRLAAISAFQRGDPGDVQRSTAPPYLHRQGQPDNGYDGICHDHGCG